MTFRVQSLAATIAQSGTLSDIVAISGYKRIGLALPNSLGNTVNLRGSWDQTSANFAPVLKTDGTGIWTVTSGALNGTAKMVDITDLVRPFDAIRVETALAVTDDAVFTIVNKL